ncbi:MAG: PDZ domain-containing protein [Candidatus Thermoplasmatota archaeon]
MPTVQVTFDCTRPETHLVRVTQRFPPAPGNPRRLRMPAWVPGSYKIRDYGRQVQDLKATVGGKVVQVDQPGKDEWLIGGADGKAVEVTFDVYCRELTVDTSHVTADHAHLFPATMLLYDSHSRHLPHKVALKLPRGWKTWTGLQHAARGDELDVADDFDHLIDCPIECGPPEDYHVGHFTVRGKPHRHVVWRPPSRVDWEHVERDMARVCSEVAKVWGELPYKHYTFLTHVAADYGGGLEHRNSTVLGADPAHFQNAEKIETRYLPLVAHEFFHTWNVKRILPAAFQPYDLQTEVYTDLLWLFEGFTSYYELPTLYRAKVCGDEAFAKMVGEDLEMYHKALGRKRTSVAKASRLTWTLLYQPHEHNVNRNVSYYTKGMWVGLCLDAELRKRGVKDGLDAVMKHLWRKHGRTAMGVTEDAFPDIVEQASGFDLRKRLEGWIHGTEELPIEAALKTLGWDLKVEYKDPKRTKGLGVEFKPGTATIARIWEDVPAFKVLQPDDEIIAAAGYKWKPESFHDQVAAIKVGQPVEVQVFREGRLRTLQVPLVELKKDKFTVTIRKKDAAGARRRKAWLGEGRAKPKKKARKAAKKAAKRGTSRKNTPPRRRVA